MDIHTKVDIYAIIPYSLALEGNGFSLFRESIDAILEIPGEAITINEVTNSSQLDSFVAKERLGLLVKNHILKFSYDLMYTVPDFSNEEDPEHKKKIFQSNKLKEAINYVYCFACNLITCSNITMPGVVGMKKCIINADNELYSVIDFYSYSNIIQIFKSYARPKLYEKNLKLKNVYEWFRKIKLNNHLSTTRLGRAIGALNYLLFSDIQESTAIMWALVAIETLYCRGSGEKQKQIIEKSKVITQSFENNKDLKNMYDARSRFFHGETDFQIYQLIPGYIWSEQTEQKNQQLNKHHLYTALMLLFETLQFMVTNNKHELEFQCKYTLE